MALERIQQDHNSDAANYIGGGFAINILIK